MTPHAQHSTFKENIKKKKQDYDGPQPVVAWGGERSHRLMPTRPTEKTY
jgi:hypothetical protein